ncbi:MAG: ATP-dependent RecD-like DNA helicase [Clostridia bacterium]|nr:AAA family ATPase [Clostridium sp.]
MKYSLIKATYNGNSCVLKENLIEYVVALLDVMTENVEDALINLKAKDEIIIEEREDGTGTWIYLSYFYNTEQEIAIRIKRLQESSNAKKIKNIKAALKKVEMNSNIELSEKQKESIELVNENNVTIITGGPGTGKTTIIKSIIDIYEEKGNKVVLCAPTGRAAKKMTETTGKESSTLHRLLEIGKIDENNFYQSSSEYEGAPIDADLIIVDELSMVDMFVMSYLLKCIYKGTKLILVGDCDQLSSVGPGNVLKDLISSSEITTIHLDKIFRQAAKSKIILNAHRVNNGEKFLSKEDGEITEETMEDFFYIKEVSQEKMLMQIVSLCTGRLKNYGDYDFFQSIQVLTPTKKGLLGTKELNKALQEKLNPNLENLPEKSNMGATFRVGDRIMQVKNNYDIDWEKESASGNVEVGKGVFNGEIGTITLISERDKIVEIRFDDDKTAYYDYSELDQIEHSYAITIHKAQRK